MREVVGLVLALTATARAHDIPPRVDRLQVDAAGWSLECTIAISGDEARQLRERYDKNDDGELDKAERLALIGYLREHATAFVRLSVDGKAAALQPASESIELGPSLLMLTARWHGDLKPGERRLRLVDRTADPRVEIPVLIGLDAAVAKTVAAPFPARVFAGHPLDLTIRYRSPP